jgi:CheY-like chemotaxis protein
MKKEKILVIEDDKSILTGLADLLEAEGYDVCTAEEGEEGLRVYARERPTLILLDIMIPEISGYDVCREIRKKDDVTPILMLTAKGQEVEKVVGLEMGADDYIVKPFGVSELLARIRAHLRRSRVKPPQPLKKTPALSLSEMSSSTLKPTTVKRERKHSPCRRGSSHSSGFLWAMTARSSRDSRCWMRSGVSVTRGPHAPWTSTLPSCVKRLRMSPPIPGLSRRSTASATVSFPRPSLICP